MLFLLHVGVWWEMNGGPIPIVRKVAIRILSQPCSASCCERNWSAFDAAQTKKRNKLLPTMLEDLVYIRMNSLMLSTSSELETRDRKAIDLEKLGPLPDYAIFDERIEEEAENQIHGEQVEDTSWLDMRFSIGPNPEE